MNQAEYIEGRIRAWFQRQEFDAFVTEKLTNPLRLMVLQVGTDTSVEAITDNGTWGAVRVGDLVRVKRGAANVASRPYELGGPANTMQLVGSDKPMKQTTSHTTYEELLRVDGLAIPADARFDVQLYMEVETVGGGGVAAKQFQIVFNDLIDVTVGLTASSATFWVPWIVSTAAEVLAAPRRSALLLTSTSSSPTDLTNLGEVTSVSIEARTNDTGEGNDIVRAAELLVFS